MKGEMKWAKVSRGKLDKYVGFVDMFFNHAAKNPDPAPGTAP